MRTLNFSGDELVESEHQDAESSILQVHRTAEARVAAMHVQVPRLDFEKVVEVDVCPLRHRLAIGQSQQGHVGVRYCGPMLLHDGDVLQPVPPSIRAVVLLLDRP